jgi:uncharacterized protein YuzE
MKIYFDEDANIFYLDLLEKKVVESETIRPGIVFDYDENNEVIGIEIMGLNGRIPTDELKKFNSP